MNDKLGLVCTNHVENRTPNKKKYLGGWCGSDHIDDSKYFINYHWDDREKYYTDYIIIEKIYEDQLIILSQALSFTNTDNISKESWRIIIGPWLFYFILVAYDRWSMLKIAQDNHSIDYIFGSIAFERIIPKSHQDFDNLITNDELNQQIYDDLANILGIPVLAPRHRENVSSKSKKSIPNKFLILLGSIKGRAIEFLKDIINRFSIIFIGTGSFFISTRIPPLELLKVQNKLGASPSLYIVQNKDNNVSSEINLKVREALFQNILQFSEPSTDFDKILANLIHLYIPISYLEGYSELKNRGRSIFPKNTKSIIDGSAWNSNDCFKIYLASKIETGTRLHLLQHGGSYGIAKWNWTENHQLKISNAFYSWGWTGGEKKHNVVPAYIQNITNIKINDSPNKNGILIVVTTVPKFCIYGSAFPVGYDQWLNGFNDLLALVNLLKDELVSLVTFRPSLSDFGLNQKNRILKEFPNIKIDDGSQKIYKVLGSYKLIIATSNTTSFLETFALNIPTIMFWDESYWEVNKESEDLFSRLKDLNLFFNCSKELSIFINKNYDSIDDWWSSHKIQDIRRELCSKYANTSNDFVGDFSKILSKELSKL